MRKTTVSKKMLDRMYKLLTISCLILLSGIVITGTEASTLTYNGTVDASPTPIGGPDCLSCHNDTFTGVHKNINSGATASGVNPVNKRCWGCHQSDGTQPVTGSMGDRYKNAYQCADCHDTSTEPYPGVGNAPVSYTHLRTHETVLDLVCRLLLEKK